MKNLFYKFVMCLIVVASVVGSASADKEFKNNVDYWYETAENWQDGVAPNWDGGVLLQKGYMKAADTVCVIRAGVEARPLNFYQKSDGSNSLVILGGLLDCTEGWDNIGRGRSDVAGKLFLRVIGDGVYNAPTCGLVVPNQMSFREGNQTLNARLNIYGGVTVLSRLDIRNPLIDAGDLGNGFCDIRNGLLRLIGDDTAEIESYITAGVLTAYNGYAGASIDSSYDSAIDQTIVKAISGANPSPANMEAGAGTGTIQLTWDTPAEPNSDTTCNVYFGSQDDVAWQNFGDPNFQQVFENLEFRKTWIPDPNVPLHEANVTDNAVEVTTGYGNVYYWQIEYVNPSGTIAAIYNFTFDTSNTAPEVVAGDNQYSFLDGGSRTITLDGQLTKDDEGPAPATPTWIVISALTPYEEEGDPVAIDSSTYSFVDDNPNLLDAQITFTVAGTYILELDAFDGELSAPYPQQVTLFIRDDACAVAKIMEGFERLPGDVDGDCDVDDDDLILMAADWMLNNAL